MIGSIHTAAVIARRDFIATVASRTFLLFLIAPLFPILFGIVFGAAGANIDRRGDPIRTLAINADAGLQSRITAAHDRLQAGGAPTYTLEPIELVLPTRKSAAALLRERKDLSGLLVADSNSTTLYGEERVLERLTPYASLLLNEAERDRILRRIGRADAAAPPLDTVQLGSPASELDRKRPVLGQVAQTLLFVLTLMLAGVLLSNFIEEKGNKVIEVLAAAAPMPAIFTGKLFAMLGSSLVGITVWSISGVIAFTMLSDKGLAGLPVPLIGWPLFLLLAVLYFSTNYLLVGALLLGIGAQAASVRQIQTISLPITMGQLVLYGLASAALNQPHGPLALIAAVFPYSSPLAMIAHAATEPGLWPHVAALAWQVLWVAITVNVTARWFKRGVLKSGPVRSPWPWRRRASA